MNAHPESRDHQDEASSQLKSWEKREATKTVHALVRRIFARSALALSAAFIGSMVFVLGVPGGGGPAVLFAPIANLVLAVALLATLGRRFSTAETSRIAFYSFTAPTWAFLVWLAFHFVDSKL